MTDFSKERLNEMRDSIWLSFHYSNKLNEAVILEAFGRVPNIDSYVDVLREKLLRESDNGNKSCVFVITDNIFSNIEGCWFDETGIEIQFKKKHLPKRYQGRITLSNGSKSISGTKNNVIESLCQLFALELVHNHETRQRQLDDRKNLFDITSSDVVLEMAESDITDTLNKLFHHINLNGDIIPFYNEIRENKELITNVDSALNIVQETALYKKYIALGDALRNICNSVTTLEQQNFVKNCLEKLSGENISVGNIVRYISQKYESHWLYLRQTTMHIVRKFYETNNVPPEWIETFDEPIKKLKDLF